MPASKKIWQRLKNNRKRSAAYRVARAAIAVSKLEIPRFIDYDIVFNEFDQDQICILVKTVSLPDFKHIHIDYYIDATNELPTLSVTDQEHNRILLIAKFANESDLILVKHRSEELTKKYIGKNISKSWIREFCRNSSESIELEIRNRKLLTREALRRSVPQTTGYYVYRHTFPSGAQYIGKGTGWRYSELSESGRSVAYEVELLSSGTPFVEILLHGLSDEKAYELENLLITNLRKNEKIRLLNVTDGCENANLIDMPGRTLRVHAAKNPSLGFFPKITYLSLMTGSYQIDVSLPVACHEMECSIGAITESIGSGESIGGKYNVLCECSAKTIKNILGRDVVVGRGGVNVYLPIKDVLKATAEREDVFAAKAINMSETEIDKLIWAMLPAHASG